MNLEQGTIAALTNEEKQELELWTELIESRGFNQLRELMEQEAQSNRDIIENAANWDQYVYARGKRDAIDILLNLQEIIEYRLSQMADERIESQRKQDEAVNPTEIDLDAGAY